MKFLNERILIKDYQRKMFHCDEKPFASGSRIGLDPQCHNFALGIPTCWYLKTQTFALPSSQMLKFALCPIANFQCKQVEYRLWQNSCIGHVDFMLFVHHFPHWLCEN